MAHREQHPESSSGFPADMGVGIGLLHARQGSPVRLSGAEIWGDASDSGSRGGEQGWKGNMHVCYRRMPEYRKFRRCTQRQHLHAHPEMSPHGYSGCWRGDRVTIPPLSPGSAGTPGVLVLVGRCERCWVHGHSPFLADCVGAFSCQRPLLVQKH